MPHQYPKGDEASVRSAQHISPDRLGHAVEDQPHAHRGDKEADDAGRRVDAARADAAQNRVGIGKEQIGGTMVARMAATIAISDESSENGCRTSEAMPSTVAFVPRATQPRPQGPRRSEPISGGGGRAL